MTWMAVLALRKPRSRQSGGGKGDERVIRLSGMRPHTATIKGWHRPVSSLTLPLVL
jgi:hypothetical protein